MNYKTSLSTFCFSLLTVVSSAENDSLGLHGDNFDLAGALELFKESESPEAFEKALNSEDDKLNNLDLNGDNETDYIRVVEHAENDARALVLQVPVSESELQDVAVIEIEKQGDETARLQIIGDEELYGKNYIVEPAPAAKTVVVVNVWTWPSVRYIYRPGYKVWISPWGWRLYPAWWKPWRPVHWHVYHPHWKRHHVHHHRVHTHHVVTAHNVYYGHRKVSATVVRSRTSSQQKSPAQVHAKRNQKQKVKHDSHQKQAGKQKHTRKEGNGRR